MNITIYPNINPFPEQGQKQALAKKATVGKCITVKNLTELSNYLTESAWSPAVFDGARKSSNFKGIQFLTYDVDKDMTIGEAKTILDYLQWSYIIAKTVNHQKDKNGVTCDRFRIIMPLATIITDINTYKYNWDRFAKYFKVDSSCRDVSRFYFGCYDGIIQENRHIIIMHPEVKHKRVTKIQKSDKIGKLSTRTESFIKNGEGTGTWHVEFLFAARDLKAQGYDFHQAESILSTITGSLDEEHDIPQLKYVYDDSSIEFEYRRG